MEHIKLQAGCLTVLLYIAFIYLRECRKYRQNLNKTFFDELISLGIISVFLDGVTAYTVNHQRMVNPLVNRILHGLFLLSLDSVIFVLCLYMFLVTGVYPKRKRGKVILFLPFIVNMLILLTNIGSLSYVEGKVTNYSMGVSAYTCFFMAAVYIFLSTAVFFKRWNYIEQHKRVSIFTYLFMIAVVTGIQMLFPEVLLSSLAVTVCVLGVYMNLEDPALKELSRYHGETVMAFANLIENRDNSTGGHIKRTSMYVELIAEELYRKGCYRDILTKSYIANLVKAAPMHDIGKISVPDAILQKPGKLTDEEFGVMKLHAQNGGKIIRETFLRLGDGAFCSMAYEVARFHHEKWNGAGYPEGRAGEEIPLCARIMSVADVFDAVSEKRCYREAMPLDKCFEIIRQGSGRDFDPVIAETFLEVRKKVESLWENNGTAVCVEGVTK